MRIGWNGGGHHTSLDTIREQARRAVEDGFASFWLSQITGPDALTALAAVAADAPRMAVGNEDAVHAQLAAFEEAGATDVRVTTLCSTPDDMERTRGLLRALCREKNRG